MGKLTDGFSTLFTFPSTTSGVTLGLYETGSTPIGVSGGGPIDDTTMRNTAYRTKSPKSLKDVTNASMTAAYDPVVLDEIKLQVNVNQLIVLTMPNGSTWTFWGYIDEFTPNEHTEGEMPTASVTIVPTNKNSSGEETAPVYAAA